MLHFSSIAYFDILSVYGIRCAKMPLSNTRFTSSKLRLGACMNTSISETQSLGCL